MMAEHSGKPSTPGAAPRPTGIHVLSATQILDAVVLADAHEALMGASLYDGPRDIRTHVSRRSRFRGGKALRMLFAVTSRREWMSWRRDLNFRKGSGSSTTVTIPQASPATALWRHAILRKADRGRDRQTVVASATENRPIADGRMSDGLR